MPNSIGVERKNLRARRTLLAVSTILCSGLAAPALAQSQSPVSVPPARETIDDNGVDLGSGNFNLTVRQVSIGNGKSSLKFERYWVTDGWRNNFSMSIRASGSKAIVSIGNASVSFTSIGGFYTPDDGMGESLTATSGTYTYTDRNGAVFSFDRSYAPYWYYGNVDALATSVTYPSGETIKLTYKNFQAPVYLSTRLQSVNSNFGYQIKLSYAASNSDVLSGVMAINNAVDYCAPSADSCPGLTQSWPVVNYTTTIDQTGLVIMDTATDARGNVTRYTSNVIGQAGLTRLVGIKRPSSSTDTTTMTYASISGRLKTYSTAGNTWTYLYYTASNFQVTRTDSLSNQRVTVVDSGLGVLLSDKDELNRTTTYAYDTNGRMTQATAPEETTPATPTTLAEMLPALGRCRRPPVRRPTSQLPLPSPRLARTSRRATSRPGRRMPRAIRPTTRTILRTAACLRSHCRRQRRAASGAKPATAIPRSRPIIRILAEVSLRQVPRSIFRRRHRHVRRPPVVRARLTKASRRLLTDHKRLELRTPCCRSVPQRALAIAV